MRYPIVINHYQIFCWVYFILIVIQGKKPWYQISFILQITWKSEKKQKIFVKVVKQVEYRAAGLVKPWCCQPCPDLVIMDDSLGHSFVEHLFVPLLQSLGLGYLLVRGVAMEDVVVAFTWWTRPNMPCCISNNTDRRNTEEKDHPF